MTVGENHRLLENNIPTHLIECELGDQDLSPHLRYLTAKYPQAKAYQVHFQGKKDYQTNERIRVCPAPQLLSQLV